MHSGHFVNKGDGVPSSLFYCLGELVKGRMVESVPKGRSEVNPGRIK